MSRYGIERVLMTADAVGGVWTYALDLARELSRYDIEVTLATMGPRPSLAQIEEASAISGLHLVATDFKLEWMPDCWSDVDAAGDWLLALADRIKPDVVHLNGYCHAALPWKAPAMVVCHSDVLSWWSAVRGAPAPAEWNEYERRVRNGLQAAEMIVAPTASVLKEMERHYGPNPMARVIWNGRTPEEEVELAPDDLILSAGRLWDEAKNVSLLDEVAGKLPWPVYVAGDMTGQVKGALPLGRLCPTAMREWMARAAIYALPAKYEPFGLSILEAAMARCALVLGDIPSLRELWQGAAIFVDPRNPQALEDALTHLIANADIRERMAQSAYERSKSYSAKAFGCGYLFAYQDMKQSSDLLQVAEYPGVSLL